MFKLNSEHMYSCVKLLKSYSSALENQAHKECYWSVKLCVQSSVHQENFVHKTLPEYQNVSEGLGWNFLTDS